MNNWCALIDQRGTLSKNISVTFQRRSDSLLLIQSRDNQVIFLYINYTVLSKPKDSMIVNKRISIRYLSMHRAT